MPGSEDGRYAVTGNARDYRRAALEVKNSQGFPVHNEFGLVL